MGSLTDSVDRYVSYACSLADEKGLKAKPTDDQGLKALLETRISELSPLSKELQTGRGLITGTEDEKFAAIMKLIQASGLVVRINSCAHGIYRNDDPAESSGWALGEAAGASFAAKLSPSQTS